MEYLWEINALLKQLETFSNNFSKGEFKEWYAGISNDPAGILTVSKHKMLYYIDCKNPKYAQAVLRALSDKGVHIEKVKAQGNFVYIFQ